MEAWHRREVQRRARQSRQGRIIVNVKANEVAEGRIAKDADDFEDLQQLSRERRIDGEFGCCGWDLLIALTYFGTSGYRVDASCLPFPNKNFKLLAPFILYSFPAF